MDTAAKKQTNARAYTQRIQLVALCDQLCLLYGTEASLQGTVHLYTAVEKTTQRGVRVVFQREQTVCALHRKGL